MTLQDLKTGMVVEMRDGRKYLIVNRDGKLFGIGMNCYMTLDGEQPHKSNLFHITFFLLLSFLYPPYKCNKSIILNRNKYLFMLFGFSKSGTYTIINLSPSFKPAIFSLKSINLNP